MVLDNLLNKSDSICGIDVSANGETNICIAKEDGSRVCAKLEFSPFAWLTSKADLSNFNARTETLSPAKNAPLDTLAFFPSPEVFDKFFKTRDKSLPIEKFIGWQNQFLMCNGARMFANMKFAQIRRLQLDIEVFSSKGFPRADREDDRIIAIGLSGFGGEKILEISEMTAIAERELLDALSAEILARDPDVIEGHNIFRFDLPYIAERCQKVGANMNWGRFGKGLEFRKTRLSIAERTVEFPRCDIAGRTVIDTMHLIQLHDISAREMESYSLKYAARYFGISNAQERTYIDGNKIKDEFFTDREKFRAYLRDDIRETAGLSDRLLPTYVAQITNFPLTLQDSVLRGTGVKVESVFLEKYFLAKTALPLPQETNYFEGALSKSFELGVFRNVLHYDVASLYPSLLLLIGRCPKNDRLNAFLDSLAKLRSDRLEYKRKARECKIPELKSEYDARQASFKILINSFYGYLGLRGAVFGDTSLADEVTRRGRELLQKLMDAFAAEGCKILEADTDGIYLSSPEYFESPELLLNKILHALPEGIDLDFDGKYEAMLCYKAKNYALLQDDKIVLRGSSFKSRSTEPFLRELTGDLVESLLKGTSEKLTTRLNEIEEKISNGTMDVEALAKCEFIGKSCKQYEADILRDGKGRRASMQAALLMSPRPELGDRVCYYIASAGDAKKTPEWNRARPLSYAQSEPYDTKLYSKKLKDWREKYSDIAPFLNEQKETQTELLF